MHREKMNGQNTVSPIKIEDDADETVDESEEKKADENYKKAPMPTNSRQKNVNSIEQKKPQKPQRQFDTQKPKLIEYDDEAVNTGSIPLPGAN